MPSDEFQHGFGVDEDEARRNEAHKIQIARNLLLVRIAEALERIAAAQEARPYQ